MVTREHVEVRTLEERPYVGLPQTLVEQLVADMERASAASHEEPRDEPAGAALDEADAEGAWTKEERR